MLDHPQLLAEGVQETAKKNARAYDAQEGSGGGCGRKRAVILDDRKQTQGG